MERCRFCGKKSRADLEACPVCGIERSKASRYDLTTGESKRLRMCRSLRFLGLFHIVVGAPLLLFVHPATLSLLTGSAGQPPAAETGLTNVLFSAAGAVLVLLGYGLWTLRSWSLHLAISTYGLAALAQVVLFALKPQGPGPIGVVILVGMLYFVGNPVSRRILLRR